MAQQPDVEALLAKANQPSADAICQSQLVLRHDNVFPVRRVDTWLKPIKAGGTAILATLTPAIATSVVMQSDGIADVPTRERQHRLGHAMRASSCVHTEQSRHSPLYSACAVRVPLALLIPGILP